MEPFDENDVVFTVFPLRFNIPCVKFIELAVKLSPNVVVVSVPVFIIKEGIVNPAEINVNEVKLAVDTSVIVPDVFVMLIPAEKVTVPPTLSPTEIFPVVPKANVPVNPVQVILRHTGTEPIVTVTAPEFASKKTSSPAKGTDAPPAVPDVADHLVPMTLFQVALPPTQNL